MAAAPGSSCAGPVSAAVLSEQSAVMDTVYGLWTGPAWRPRAFERTAPRYLWTDAFGVCNYLTLYLGTKQDRYLLQAAALIDDVLAVLGHKRGPGPAGASAEWLTGASADHPTAAGLRIGKKHPEGHPDGDGQYFHYLTKFAFALGAAAAVSGEHRYLQWAVELLQRCHSAFVTQDPSGSSSSSSSSKRMVWKMNVDLTHPAVSSMGNLDPYDGLVTYSLVAGAAGGSGVLAAEVADMAAMVERRYKSYQSDDPLDLGEALWLSHWHCCQQQQQQLAAAHGIIGGSGPGNAAWADHIAAVSSASLDRLFREGYFEQPRQWRLAFREFGTSIGLQALVHAQPRMEPAAARQLQQRVRQIHSFWSEHLTTRDNEITPVMYAASLNPGVWLHGRAWQ